MTQGNHASRNFLLVGNGPYANRGCEAIALSTVGILRTVFGEKSSITHASYGPPEGIRLQGDVEADRSIRYIALSYGRYSLPSVEDKIGRVLGVALPGRHRMLVKPLENASAVLECGGDNYSLDYGVPYQYLAMDAFILERRKPLVLWGASVGPFSANPEFERKIASQLRRVDLILARESLTVEYLRTIGVSDNVRLIADPAFLLEPEAPLTDLPEVLADAGRAIGINLSPLVASFGAGGLDAWKQTCAETLVALTRRFGADLLLVPHVLQHPWNDDYGFLAEVADLAASATGIRVPLLPKTLMAKQLKWCIARCRVFAGARTHATIAALSSCVPTVSIAYSMKARGINIDTLDTLDYCIPASSVDAGSLPALLERTLEREADLRAHLLSRMPVIKLASMRAAHHVADVIGSPAR